MRSFQSLQDQIHQMAYRRITTFLTFLLLFHLLLPALSFAASSIAGSTSLSTCEEENYIITVDNNSGSSVCNLELESSLPNANFVYITGTSTLSHPVPGPETCTSNADPSVSGTDLTWDVDGSCPTDVELLTGESLTVEYTIIPNCDAVSGSNQVTVRYDDCAGTPGPDETDIINLEVRPGDPILSKSPAVIQAGFGEVVTWTLTVENTGLGDLLNLVVSEVPGAGLVYDSVANISTGTWDAGALAWTIPGPIAPGDSATIDVNFIVNSCTDLENVAHMKWGCDADNICFDTTVDGGSATAAVELQRKTPDIAFSNLNPINFDYCSASEPHSITITNNGDGIALGTDGTGNNTQYCVDYSGFSVSNIAPAGVTYNSGTGCFENFPDLTAGGSFDLTYEISYDGDLCSGPTSRTLIWEPRYYDECGNEFLSPVVVSNLVGPTDIPTLTVSKTGATEITFGSQVSYNIVADYTGPVTCGTGGGGTVTVTDTLPPGFTVADAGGGTVSGDGSTITWTYDTAVDTHFDTTIILNSPIDNCQDVCGTVVNNLVEAEVVNCCGCTLTATSIANTAIECRGAFDSDKTVMSTIPTSPCDAIQYENSFDFEPTATGVLSDLTFSERADNAQTYVPGSLTATLGGSSVATDITDNTPGGTLEVTFPDALALAGQELLITYEMQLSDTSLPDPSCGSTYNFYSWSDMEGTAGIDCPVFSRLSESTQVPIEPPAMTLNVSGIPTLINKCETFPAIFTLTQTSTTSDPYDVLLTIPTDNYYVVNVTGTSGVLPISGPNDLGDRIEFEYGDNFATGGNVATINTTIRKRCEGDAAFTASIDYDDKCKDDATTDSECTAEFSYTPPLFKEGRLIIEKNPEIIYASNNQVTWIIYVTNTGTGPAYNVWIDDEMAAGLDYVEGSAVVTATGTSYINDNIDHESNGINGVTVTIDTVQAAERVEIAVTAELVDCNNLLNTVSTAWGCTGAENCDLSVPENCWDASCPTEVQDTATVTIPDGKLITTSQAATPLAPCSETPFNVTLKNSGVTTLYNLDVTQTLPAGLYYKLGTTEWQINGGGWTAGADPASTTSPLNWTETELPVLAESDPGDTIEIRFTAAVSCSFAGGISTTQANYNNPCGDTKSSQASNFTLGLVEPGISISKSRTTPAGTDPLSCSQAVTWEITATNTGSVDIPVLWVEDTLGAFFNFDSCSASSGSCADGYGGNAQLVSWELTNLSTGASETLTINAVSADGTTGCTGLDNSAVGYWGCGTVDGNATSKPGVDECTSDPNNGDYCCLFGLGESGSHTSTIDPGLAVADIDIVTSNLAACGGDGTITLTLENPGPTEASFVDVVATLPTGLSFNNAVTPTVACPGVGSGPGAIPGTSGQDVIFYDPTDDGNNLCDSLPSGGSASVIFGVISDCFLGGDLDVEMSYSGCCSGPQYTTNDTAPISSDTPVLTVVKTPATAQIDCGDTQIYTITVTNTSSVVAETIRIEDTPGQWLAVDLTNPGNTTGLTDFGGGVYGWEDTTDLAAGASRDYNIAMTLTKTDENCSLDRRRNNVRATWLCEGSGCNPGTWVNAPTTNLLMPDLRVTDIDPEITCVIDGSFSSTVDVTVRNYGNGSVTTAFTVELTDGTWTGTGTYAGTIAPNASAVISIDTTGWNPDCNNCTPYTLTATVDSTDAVCDCNESNNTLTETYTAPIPKLAITSVDPSPICNDASSVDVTVENQGCASVPAGVEVEITGDATGTATTNSSLAASGGSEVVTVSLGTITCDASYDITATVDPGGLVCECDDTNHSDTASFDSPCCSIDLEKSTNTEDADTPTGPYIAVGDTVTWDYLVTNTGNTVIDAISLTDDQINTVTCPQTSLAIGASMTCTATATAATGTDQYENNADVEGTPVDGVGTIIGNDLTDSDPSHFYAVEASIDIEKATNTEDADTPTGPYIPIGDPVNWTYVVENTGNTILIDIVVTDSLGVVVTCPAATLAIGASMTCTGSGTAALGQYSNIGEVTADPADNVGTSLGFPAVTDTDPSHYFGESPAVEVEKATNTEDADTPTGPYIPIGDPVTWTYVIENTGNVTLTNITLTDDILGNVGGTCLEGPIPAIDPGDTFTCTSPAGTATIGQYSNLATVTGTSPAGADVTDDDPSNYFGQDASIDIEKATNGQDADSVPGPYVPIGDPVSWTYEVTNTGNVELTDVTVVDDQGVTVTCPQTVLAIGASMTCTAAGTSVIDQYENNGSVTGTPPSGAGDNVTDTDPSHYFGEDPAIEVEKSTNTEDADTPTGPYIPIGDPVTWTYVIENTGNVTLTNITLTDDIIGNVGGTCLEGPIPAIDPGDTFTCTSPAGTATINQYSNLATVTGTSPTGADVTDDDPSNYFGQDPSIDIEKATNGQDADSAPGPLVPIGDPVNWTYEVTNTGNVELTDVTVVDDQGVTVTCPQTVLAAGASMTCTATGVSVIDQYENNGSVTGTPPTGPGDNVTDTDPSHYFGESPAIEVEKATNTEDADTPTGPYIQIGDPVTWTYVIENTGNVILTNVTLTDDILGNVGGTCLEGPIPALDPGDTFTCTSPAGTATIGQYTNLATVTGTPPVGVDVTDDDPSNYFGQDPSIDIEKATNGQDADSVPGPFVPIGDPVAWTYEVTNTGNVEMTDVAVVDDQGVTVTCPQTILAVGASMTCTATGASVAGQYENNGSVTGTPPTGPGDNVTDTDPSHYFGEAPAIEVEKATNGQDADTPTGPYIQIGDPVTWTYVIENTGNVTLTNVTLTDDILGGVGTTCLEGPIPALDPGDLFTCTTPAGTATIDQYSNLATVTGTPPVGIDVTDDDPSNYFGQDPSIDIEKATNGEDADTPTGPYILVGDPVSWTYEVINTGNVTLTDVTVSDDQGVTVTCPTTTLTPGQAMTCTGSGTAVGGQYANNGSVAGTPPVGPPVEDIDPSHYLGPLPGISLEKATNGEDADTPTGPYILDGNVVTWTYVIKNTGNVDLVGVKLVDDQLGNISSRCTQGKIPNLAPGASYTCTVKGTATPGQYKNSAEVTGKPADSVGTPLALPPVKDDDPSHYFGSGPSISLEKATNGEDADSPTGPEITQGQPVTWSYVVNNTGNVVLTNVIVTDSQGVSVSCPKTSLAVGESMTCTGTGVATTGQYANEGSVTGNTPDGSTVGDDDPSHYFGRTIPIPPITGGKPEISVSKSANPTRVAEGDIVQYSIQINNISKFDAANVEVRDTLPPGFSYIPSTSVLDGTGIADPSGRTTLTWIIDSVRGGQTRTLRYQVRVPVNLTDQDYINTVTAGGDKDTAIVTSVPDTFSAGCCLTVEKELVTHEQPPNLLSATQDIYFITHMAMFAAHEFSRFDSLLKGENVPEASNHKIALHREKITNRVERFSRHNIGNLSTNSGLGLGMEYSPGFSGKNLDERKQQVQSKLKQLAEKAGWKGDTSNLNPLFLEYYGSIPTREEGTNSFWDEEGMEKVLSPAAWGMTILAQSGELQRLSSSQRSEDKFLALLLAWQLQEKVDFIDLWLQNDPETSYLPHALRLVEDRSANNKTPWKFTVSKQGSTLLDQAAMLWGLTALQQLDEQSEKINLPKLKEISKKIWNRLELHFNEDLGVWSDSLGEELEKPDQTGSDQDEPVGDYISAGEILIAALATKSMEQTDSSWFTFGKYSNRITAATRFLLGRVDENGGLPDRIRLTVPSETTESTDSAATAESGVSDLEATAALIRLQQLTGQKSEADNRYKLFEKLLWDQENQLYRDNSAWGYEADYSPITMAVFMEMFRGLSEGEQTLEAVSFNRGLAFIDRILYQAGLQLSPEKLADEARLPILEADDSDNKPILPVRSDDRKNSYLQEKSVPVFCREISLNLLPTVALEELGSNQDITKFYRNLDENPESNRGSFRPQRMLTRQKARMVSTESATLGANYLIESAALLSNFSVAHENPYLVDPFGLKDLARESDALWQNAILSIGFAYNQGIPLRHAPAIRKRASDPDTLSPEILATVLQSEKDVKPKSGIDLSNPLYLEFNQGEPDSTGLEDGWATRPAKEQLSLTTLGQVERTRLALLKKATDKTLLQDKSITSIVANISQLQTSAKLEFLLSILEKSSEQNLALCPEKISIVRDSRGLPLEFVFESDKPALTGQLSVLLAIADSLQMSGSENAGLIGLDTIKDKLIAAFDKLVVAITVNYSEPSQEEIDESLFHYGTSLDLLAQLANHPACENKNEEPLTRLLKVRMDPLVVWLKNNRALKAPDKTLAELTGDKDRLAALASATLALIRIDKQLKDVDLSKTISQLVHSFDDKLWNERIGCYQGTTKYYNSSELRRTSYPYSELDIVLPLAALSYGLEYLEPEEQPRVLTHLTLFAKRLLSTPQLSSTVLTENQSSSFDYDSEMLQDIEIGTVDPNRLYSGSILEYRINVYNRCPGGQTLASPLESIDVTDILPPSVRYVPGSTHINGSLGSDPEVRGNRLRWEIGSIFDKTEILFSGYLAENFDDRELDNRVEVVGWQSLERTGQTCEYNDEITNPVNGRNSTIRIKYFEDSNANNSVDPGEKGVPGIKTWLADRQTEVSGEDGEAVFRDLAPGAYQAKPLFQELQTTHTLTGKVPVDIDVREFEDKLQTIGLLTTTTVTGWAFDDINNNGQRDENEPPIAALQIQTKGDARYIGFSASDGFFKIERVPISIKPEVEVSEKQPYAGNLLDRNPQLIKQDPAH